PAACTGIGHDRNDDVGFAGMGDDLRDALPGKAVITRKHHDVGRSRSAGAALVGATEPEIGRVVENSDGGIGRREGLHALQSMIGARVVDEDDLVAVLPPHRLAHRANGCYYVVLLVETRNDETECGSSGHGGSCGLSGSRLASGGLDRQAASMINTLQKRFLLDLR